MRKVGSIKKYKGPTWAYDLMGWFIQWQGKAEELKRASDVIFEAIAYDFNQLRECGLRNIAYNGGPSLLDTFIFISGLCVENLLKGIIVSDNPKYVSKGKLRGSVITSHDLLLLAREAKITLSNEERIYCELASEAIVSFGRYPVPANISKFNDKIVINADSQVVFENLYQRLLPVLPERFKNRKR